MGKLPITQSATYIRPRHKDEADLNISEEVSKGLSGWVLDADDTFAGNLSDHEAVRIEVSNLGRAFNSGATPRVPFTPYIPSLNLKFGQTFSQPIADFVSGNPDTYTITGPAWLNIDANTGVISGTAPAVAETDVQFRVGLVVGGSEVDYVYALYTVEDNHGVGVTAPPTFTSANISTETTRDEAAALATSGTYTNIAGATVGGINVQAIAGRWRFLGQLSTRQNFEYLNTARPTVNITLPDTTRVTIYGPEILVKKAPNIDVMLAWGNSNSNNMRALRKALHTHLMGTTLDIPHCTLAGSSPSQRFINSKIFAKDTDNFDDSIAGGERDGNIVEFRSELKAAEKGTFTAFLYQLNNGYTPDFPLFTSTLTDPGISYTTNTEEIVFQMLDEMADHEPEKGIFLTTVWPTDGPATAAAAADDQAWWSEVDATVQTNSEVIPRYVVSRLERDLPVPRIRQIPADVLVQAMRDAAAQTPTPLWAQELLAIAGPGGIQVNSCNIPDGEVSQLTYTFDQSIPVLMFGGIESAYKIDAPGSIHMAPWAKWTYACMEAAMYGQRSCVNLPGDRALFADNYPPAYMELYLGDILEPSATRAETIGAQGRRPEDLSPAARKQLQELAMDVIEAHPYTGYTQRPAPVLKPSMPNLALVASQAANATATFDLKEYLFNVTDVGVWFIRNAPTGVTLNQNTGILSVERDAVIPPTGLDITRWQHEGQVTIPGLTVEVTFDANAPIDVVSEFAPLIYLDQTDPATTAVVGGSLVDGANVISITSKGSDAAVLDEATAPDMTKPDLVDVGGTLLLDFDGTQYLTSAFSAFGAIPPSRDFTVAMAVDVTGAAPGQFLFSKLAQWGVRTSGGNTLIGIGDDETYGLDLSGQTGLHLLIYSVTGGKGTMWLRGPTGNTQVAVSDAGGLQNNQRITLGNGNGTASSSPLTGKLGSAIMFDRALSLAELNNLGENYYFAKYDMGVWGTAIEEVTLPQAGPIDPMTVAGGALLYWDQTDPATTATSGAHQAGAVITSLTSKGSTAAVLGTVPPQVSAPTLVDVNGALLLNFNGSQGIHNTFSAQGGIAQYSAYTLMFVYDATGNTSGQGVFLRSGKWGISVSPGSFRLTPDTAGLNLAPIAPVGLNLAVMQFAGGVGGTATLWLRGATNDKTTVVTDGPAADSNQTMFLGITGTNGQNPYTGTLGSPLMFNSAPSLADLNTLAEQYYFRKYDLGLFQALA